MQIKIRTLISLLIFGTLLGWPGQALAKSYLILMAAPSVENAQTEYNYNSLVKDAAANIARTFDARTEFYDIDVTQTNPFEPYLNQQYDLIITVGDEVCMLACRVAKQNPAQKFAFIDFGEADLPPNTCAYRFDGSEGAFLAGFLAAQFSKDNQLGFVGGLAYPQVQKMGQAFAAGARYADAKAQVTKVYLNSFFDIPGGQALAGELYNDVQIIFHAAGLSGHGVIEAAQARRNKWVIGVDADQYPLAPDSVLTSVVLDLEMAMMDACRSVEADRFPEGRRFIMNLANDGVRLGDTSNVPPAIMQTVELVKAGIINNSIVINKTL